MKGIQVLWLALAGVACLAATACGAAAPVARPDATATPTAQVHSDTGRLVRTLSGSGLECGKSGYYPDSPGVQFCSGQSGTFDERVVINGGAENAFHVTASLKTPSSQSRPTADLVRTTYGEVASGLFSGSDAARVNRWLTQHADGGGGLDLGNVTVSLDTGSSTLFQVSGRTDPGAGTQSPLRTLPSQVQQHAEGLGLSCQANVNNDLVSCRNAPGGPVTRISAQKPTGQTGTAGIGMISIVVEGPPAPAATYAGQVGPIAQMFVQDELSGSGDKGAADRAVKWLMGRADGAQHTMVFNGLELYVAQRGASATAIGNEDVVIQPAVG